MSIEPATMRIYHAQI